MGWFSVARANELSIGGVKRVIAFDRELALYRTESGIPVVQDAFCPHLGAHLGVDGRVVGERIQCPFHGWEFVKAEIVNQSRIAKKFPEQSLELGQLLKRMARFICGFIRRIVNRSGRFQNWLN